MKKLLAALLLTTGLTTAVTTQVTADDSATNLFWGDTHLHTSNSFDAFLNGNVTADPDTAYRWAKGQPVIHPWHRAWVQIDRPLDFLVVSDHAEMMGVMPAALRGDEFPKVGFIDSLKRWYVLRTIKSAVAEGRGPEAFADLLPAPDPDAPQDIQTIAAEEGIRAPFGDTREMEQSAWDGIAEAADRHNKPGKFTAIIGWEWSTIPGGANLHRVVMSSTDGETAKKFLPYGSDDSNYPEDLWAWLKKTTAETGAPFIAIPHNSNISKGYMFAETTLRGEKITSDYARLRAEMEPIVEITQIKGDSETWPSLSPDDGFADFNAYPHYIQTSPEEYVAHEGDYIRPALKRGLAFEQKIGVNPYKFGVIGSTDAHSGIASADSDNFHSKIVQDSIPENKFRNPIEGSTVNGWSMSAAGYAGVWAAENTREAIFAAFKRREVYASTGPRISLRVFGGYDFDNDDASAADLAKIGYDKGVPMGGDLIAKDSPVQLLIRAVKDPKGANLDRVQVVKGWVDSDGTSHEKVYDVAVGGDHRTNKDGSINPVGNTVDLETAAYTNSIGGEELATVWTDPDYDASQRAFYYVRVIEIPTPRHSLFDVLALQGSKIDFPMEDAEPLTIQERAYSSAIWVTP
ncbi:MAG: DUF3604 domain-containing protein [Alphaproteobacteria bacterium]